jgi:hypothetical protein
MKRKVMMMMMMTTMTMMMMMMMMMMNDVLEMFHAPAARGPTVEDRKLLQQQLTHIHTNQTQRPLAWGARQRSITSRMQRHSMNSNDLTTNTVLLR